MKRKTQSEGFLYKHNIKIHKNLWIPYTLALIIGIVIIATKGIS